MSMDAPKILYWLRRFHVGPPVLAASRRPRRLSPASAVAAVPMLCGAGTRACRARTHRGARGQALVEFALTFLLLVLPIVLAAVLAVNWGGWLYAWIEVDNAARVGAKYAALGSASIGSPTPPTYDEVITLTTRNLSSLPTTSCPTPDYFPSNDPEGNQDKYVSITCIYTPLIPGFGFPTLGVSRTAVMRVLQVPVLP